MKFAALAHPGRAAICGEAAIAPVATDHRRKLSEAQRRRGARPPKAGRPWTAAEDELGRTLPAPEAAARTGRPLCSVYGRRRQLNLPDGRKKVNR